MAALPSVADLLGGQTGYERGAQAFDNGYNGVRGMRVNDLAKSYFTGDPSTRDATLQQIAAINPQAADNISKWTMGQENQRNMQLANIARGVLSFKDPAAQRGIYQNTIMPAAKRHGLQIPEWDDATTPQWLQYQLAQSGAAKGVEGRVVGNRIVDPTNGNVIYEGPTNAQLVDIPDGQGGSRKMLFDPQTRQVSELPRPATQTTITGPSGQQIRVDPSLPKEVQDAILSDPNSWSAAPDGANAQIGAGAGYGYTPPKPDVTPYQQALLGLAERTANRADAAAARTERGTPPAGYRWNADGTGVEPIPGSPLPDAASKANEGEKNAAGFYERMRSASAELSKIEQSGYDPTNLRDYATAGTTLGNYATSDLGQRYYQAKMNWVRANLRKESGAAIGADEAKQEIKNYFPVPGDTPETIKQKARNRAVTEDAMLKAAGRAAPQTPSGASPQSGNYSNLWK